jgi:hypothetical protein
MAGVINVHSLNLDVLLLNATILVFKLLNGIYYNTSVSGKHLYRADKYHAKGSLFEE